MHDPRNGNLFAALNHGHFGIKLHRSTDSGETWPEIAAPHYPPMPEGYIAEASSVSPAKPIDWALKLIWGLAPGGADQPGVALVRDDARRIVQIRRQWRDLGTESPALGPPEARRLGSERRRASGYSFDLRRSARLASRQRRRFDGRRLDHARRRKVLGADGKAACARNTSRPNRCYDPIVQDVHCLAQCAANPDVFWVQHHNGIFRSTDGAASWTEIKDVKPSVFGFPVAVHPKNPDTAWFVPSTKDEKRCPTDGRVVVNRTSDGGKTFETLERGLPQEHAYDLVYRHGLDVDETGDRLASDRRPVRSGSAKTAAIPGRTSRRICRRCMPSGSRKDKGDPIKKF